MAIISVLFISLLASIHPTSSTSAGDHHIHPPSINAAPAPPDLLQQACKATKNQQLCVSSLSPYPKGNVMEILKWSVTISMTNLRQAQAMVQSILKESTGKQNQITAANNCVQHLNNSDNRLRLTVDALPKGDIKNGRNYTSAALTSENDCLSALQKVKGTKTVDETTSFMNTLISYTSNALSMITAYDLYGNQTSSWKPSKAESGGESDGGGRKLGDPAELKADVTVCKGAGCDYTTVQAAVNAAPDWGYGRRFVNRVKSGVYEETVRVGLEKQNVVVLGDGMGKTVITGSLNVGQPGLSTYNKATLGVVGDGFMASGLTIENTDANK